MLFRNISRRAVPATLQTIQTFKLRISSQFKGVQLNKTYINPLGSVNNNNGIRFYSQQINASDLPVVDFDYVKRATTHGDIMIVDVREPDEVKEHGKIPNSINIPLGTIETSLALPEGDFQKTFNRPKPQENTEMIFYCMIGKRSAKARDSAFALGYKNVKNYLGSWTDWAVKTQ